MDNDLQRRRMNKIRYIEKLLAQSKRKLQRLESRNARKHARRLVSSRIKRLHQNWLRRTEVMKNG